MRGIHRGGLARRAECACATALLAMLLVAGGASQSLLTVALSDLSRYVGAAARLVTNAIRGIQQADTGRIPAEQRSKAAEDLREISQSIIDLRVSQMRLIEEDLTPYVKTVRERGFASVQDVRTWDSILGSVGVVSRIVDSTLQLVDRSDWLKVAVSAEDRLALREVLAARADLLTRLRNLPAPTKPEEIDQLDRMNQHYRELFKALGGLNAALTHTADTLDKR